MAAGPLPRPGPPSLPHGARPRRLGTAFAALAVLCGPLTPAGPSAFVLLGPRAYRSRGAQQVSPGKARTLRGHPVASTPVAPTDNRASPLGAGSPATVALRRFACARNGLAPMASTGPPLTGCGNDSAPARGGAPPRRPCLVGVGFPPSGPRVRTCTCVLTSGVPGHAGRTPHPLPAQTPGAGAEFNDQSETR